MGTRNIAIIGAGLVGEEIIKCLRKSNVFGNDKFRVLARSSRKQILGRESFDVKEISPKEFEKVDIAFFAGTEGEKGAAVMFARKAIERGTVVIDNGADFRMDEKVPLVIPEINPQDLEQHQGLIANPNCSTIIALMSLWPIYQVSPIKRIIVSTYQAVSGTGKKALKEFKSQIIKNTFSILELENLKGVNSRPKIYPHEIAFNLFPEIGKFEKSGFSTEELKMVKETHKIFGDKSIAITATTVRVPIINCHSETIYIETKKRVTVQKARDVLSQAPGIRVVDPYPTPQVVNGKADIFVGRIRKDLFVKNALNLWVVGDNLLKGAALNAVQIGEELVKRNLLRFK